MNSIPYDSTNSTNPHLINTNKSECIIDGSGNALTADYIWSKNGSDREKLLDWVFDYYRARGFPHLVLNPADLNKQFNNLKRNKANVMNFAGEIKNSGSTGTDILRHFCSEKFYSSKRGGKTDKSLLDVFNDDDLFKRVLKNRMGWCKTAETGVDRPYVFGINDKMILQGIRSSGLGSIISHFKPVVAKFIYQRYCSTGDTVLDYSAGWGARLIAAKSLGLNYYGIDPNTSPELTNMASFYGGSGKLYDCGSEDPEEYTKMPKMDYVMSCPSYFDMEVYDSSDPRQCYNKFSDYQTWLDSYWKPTVENCISVMKPSAKFSLIVVNKHGKFDLAVDMINICMLEGLKLIETVPIMTSSSHLTNKRTTKKVTKTTEALYTFERV